MSAAAAIGAGVLGQGVAFAHALAQARALRLPHALLVTGAMGTGKTLASRALAQALLCEGPQPASACGACTPCRKVAQDQHPDLLLLTVPEDKTEIPVEHVRELQSHLQLHALEGRARVALVDPADALNEQGQNALLKTLEEPGTNTFLLLPTSQPEALLPTVRSRVGRLALRPLEPAGLAQLLAARGHPDREKNALAAEAARGSLGRAEVLVAEDLAALVALADQALVGDPQESAPALARRALAGASGRAQVEARARHFLHLVRWRLLARVGAALAAGDDPAYCPGPLDRWISQGETLCDIETDLDLSVPPEQALTGALLRLQDCS